MRARSLLGLVLTLACRQSLPPDVRAVTDSGATYVPGNAWRTAAPAQVGFDGRQVEALTSDVTRGRFGTIDALLVVRFGHLVLEQYNGWTPSRAHTMQSVTKSITSLAFGILQA